MSNEIDSIGIIGSADGPTAIYVSEAKDNIEEGIVTKDINDELNSRTMAENFDAGFKIMGIGMIAVFGVLTILYIVIKIMGHFAKGKDDKNEKN